MENDQVTPLPLCTCGCKEPVKKMTSKFIRGHHSRVNNISKRSDIKEKRRNNFLKMHSEGKLGKPWNKGLTSETDERVAKYGKSGSETWTEEKRERYSKQMSTLRLDGTIPTQFGSNHSMWKGGTSELSQIIRASGNLYREWRYPILKRDKFCCTKCGRTTELNVHHDKEKFADIMHLCIKIYFDATYREYDVSNIPELMWEEKKAIEQTVVSYHLARNISGITLCYDCHGKIHESEKDVD